MGILVNFGRNSLFPSQLRTLIWEYWSIWPFWGPGGAFFGPPDPPLGGSEPPLGGSFWPQNPPPRPKTPKKGQKFLSDSVRTPVFDGKFGRENPKVMHNQGYPLGCARRGGSGPPQKWPFLTPKWGFFDPQGPPPEGGPPPPGGQGGVFPLVLGGPPPPRPRFWGVWPPDRGVWGAFCLANPVPSYGNIGQFWPFWGPGGGLLGPRTPHPGGGPRPLGGTLGGFLHLTQSQATWHDR